MSRSSTRPRSRVTRRAETSSDLEAFSSCATWRSTFRTRLESATCSSSDRPAIAYDCLRRPGAPIPATGSSCSGSLFDATLRLAAIAAGAEFFDGRADEPIGDDGRLDGFSLSSTMRLRADVIVGADGATSRVAEVAGLVDPGRVLWGFAVRTYLDEPVEMPHIMLWTPVPGAGFPGYGWVFPAGGGRANVGLGVGVLADRTAGRRAARDLDAFLEHATARRCS